MTDWNRPEARGVLPGIGMIEISTSVMKPTTLSVQDRSIRWWDSGCRKGPDQTQRLPRMATEGSLTAARNWRLQLWGLRLRQGSDPRDIPTTFKSIPESDTFWIYNRVEVRRILLKKGQRVNTLGLWTRGQKSKILHIIHTARENKFPQMFYWWNSIWQ